jgi:DUF3089 family protein
MRRCRGSDSRASRLALVGSATVLAVTAAACAQPGTTSNVPSGQSTALVDWPVSHPTVWLCRPDLVDDPCQGDRSVTVFAPTGTRTVVQPTPRPSDVDCFYVYPTTALLPAENAPLRADEPELRAARSQAARFSDVCQVYAPVYRQYTVPLLLGNGPSPEAISVAYDDVVSAWHDYLVNDNQGRPFVLVGDGQGAEHLARLVREEVDGNPELRARLVSALLLGADVTVAQGQDTGGDFANIPACRNHDRAGCVVAYSAFTETPPADARVGRLGNETPVGRAAPDGTEILCTNPAALGGGTAAIDPYFATQELAGDLLVGQPVESLPAEASAFVSYPRLYEASCQADGDARWLQIDSTPAVNDDRAMPATSLDAEWGLYAVEFNLTLGDLVRLVARQTRAYQDSH